MNSNPELASVDQQRGPVGQHSAAIDWAINTRRTEKVLATEPIRPSASQANAVSAADQSVRDAVAIAGWAPFHYDRNMDGVAEPWRMQILFHAACRNLSGDFAIIVSDMKPGNKLPAMMNACGALVLVNWLPQDSGVDASKLEQVNREHHAAASAAVQNLLLALHARGLGTYWSSGGPLGGEAVQEKLGITTGQSLVAAVFVDYPFLTADGQVERVAGKNRAKRSSVDKWASEISYGSETETI